MTYISGGAARNIMHSPEISGVDSSGFLTPKARAAVGDDFMNGVHEISTQQKSNPSGYRRSREEILADFSLDVKVREKYRNAWNAIDASLAPLNPGFDRPVGQKAIHAVLEKYWNATPRKLVVLRQISAASLALLHPGSSAAEVAKHLHPFEPGLTTGNGHEDDKLVTVLWEYQKPKSGSLHPEPIELTDGSLRAAFLTKEAGDLTKYLQRSERCHDLLSGNEHALDESYVKRTLHGTFYRFRSYFQGIGEGSSMPRFNGSIGANLLLTSLPISAVLYGLLYGIDYGITKHQLTATKHKVDQHVNDSGSTYSLGS